jgi:PEP-CTERM motif
VNLCGIVYRQSPITIKVTKTIQGKIIMRIRSLILPLAACLAIAAAPAKASVMDITYFSLPSDPAGVAKVTLELDTSSPKFSSPLGLVFDNVSMEINGSTVLADIAFLPAAQGGGLSIFSIPVAELANTNGITGTEIDAGGAVLFSADDKLIDGTFSLDAGAERVTIAAAVPEPTTWAMMLLGFAGIGFTAYRRKRNGTAFRLA